MKEEINKHLKTTAFNESMQSTLYMKLKLQEAALKISRYKINEGPKEFYYSKLQLATNVSTLT